jgi:hypothetical protein
MGTALATARAASNYIDRPNEFVTDQMVENVFAAIAKTLWPKNTAPFLAAAIQCEVRTAERYLEGSRSWSGDAIAVIVAEILKRHAMRNVKVVSRQ